MEISANTTANQFSSLYILKSANKQPELAGELISMTIASMQTMQTIQAVSEQVNSLPEHSASGRIVNTVA